MTETKRPTSEGAERQLGVYYPVLDHGFVALTDYMGTDEKVDRNARVSHGSTARSPEDVRRLLRYLRRNHHDQPTEFAGLEFHCRLPIFVARQWIRHRTATTCEQSGRYTTLPSEFYRPDEWRAKSETDKSGSAGAVIDPCLDIEYDLSCRRAFNVRYTLDTAGVARELSRLPVPLSTYTEWYWKIDLRNLLHFLALREDVHAQPEIQAYARVMAGIVKEAFPITYESWVDYDAMSATFSREEMLALQRVITSGVLPDSVVAKLSRDYACLPDHTLPAPMALKEGE